MGIVGLILALNLRCVRDFVVVELVSGIFTIMVSFVLLVEINRESVLSYLLTLDKVLNRGPDLASFVLVPNMDEMGFNKTLTNVTGPLGLEKDETCWQVAVDHTLMVPSSDPDIRRLPSKLISIEDIAPLWPVHICGSCPDL